METTGQQVLETKSTKTLHMVFIRDYIKSVFGRMRIDNHQPCESAKLVHSEVYERVTWEEYLDISICCKKEREESSSAAVFGLVSSSETTATPPSFGCLATF